jgi:hypothetical protein
MSPLKPQDKLILSLTVLIIVMLIGIAFTGGRAFTERQTQNASPNSEIYREGILRCLTSAAPMP